MEIINTNLKPEDDIKIGTSNSPQIESAEEEPTRSDAEVSDMENSDPAILISDKTPQEIPNIKSMDTKADDDHKVLSLTSYGSRMLRNIFRNEDNGLKTGIRQLADSMKMLGDWSGYMRMVEELSESGYVIIDNDDGTVKLTAKGKESIAS